VTIRITEMTEIMISSQMPEMYVVLIENIMLRRRNKTQLW